jgi:BirA family biotin operon repressor/biotin-[acetyl-CoA-carboxylase] ligase
MVPMPLDDLDPAAITARLALEGELLGVELLDTCRSTNSLLLERAHEPGALLLIAREQTAGRGRRGRRWSAPRDAALTFSLRWRFAGPVHALRGLPLAAGVALARALHALGAREVGLKWPNDLMATGRNAGAKLGGILIETRAAGGGTAAIIGVGLNWRAVPLLEQSLRRRVAALEQLLQPLPRRDVLVARLAAELARALRAFERGGLALFCDEWEALDALRGHRLRVSSGRGRVVSGYADGLAADGGLRLRTRGGVRTVHSGSVALAGTA